MKKFGKRSLAILLTVLMLVTIYPSCVYAKGEAAEQVAYTVAVQDQQIIKGESAKLSAVISPEAPEVYTVEWSSSATSVVKIDEDGTAHALRRGTAKITCTVLDADKNVLCSTACSVEVLNKKGRSVSEFFEDLLWTIFRPVIEPIIEAFAEQVIAPVASEIISAIFTAIIKGFVEGFFNGLKGNV